MAPVQYSYSSTKKLAGKYMPEGIIVKNNGKNISRKGYTTLEINDCIWEK